MSDHPNVKTVNRMTQAIVEQDKDTLAELFTDDYVFHLRGPYHRAGDHAGVGALLEVLGSVFEVTSGDQHYHVPLLLSPFGYSTYRGS